MVGLPALGVPAAAMVGSGKALASGMAAARTAAAPAMSGAGAAIERLAGAAADALPFAGEALASSGGLFELPAAVLLFPRATAADDTLSARGLLVQGGGPNGGVPQTESDDLVALEYRGQLRNNTLSLLARAEPALKQGLNQDPKQPRLEVHHTIPYKDEDARKVRDVLEKWGLSIHDPADAAILPSTYHRGEDVHGGADDTYNERIVSEMLDADKRATRAAKTGGREAGRATVLEELRTLSDRLVDESKDPRAIGLEQALRILERPLPRPELSNILHWKGYGP